MAAIWTLAAASSLVKLLLIPAYRSTDFEVHRNWLAITHSLPMRKWYLENTSEWTLDYPPLFAVFECFLSIFAKFFDPLMLKVSNLNYASKETVLFQRLSVIFTDFIYFYAVKEFQRNAFLISRQKGKKINDFNFVIIPVMLIFNIGLFIVDHIHFQYNGILSGILLLSITRIFEHKNLEGAFWFTILLNMKHIYLYIAPAYFIFLLRTHCFHGHKPVTFSNFSISRFTGLVAIVCVVFLISFGPFIYFHQIGQVLSRLFPFKRGLVHAYWAPNFWALYTAMDKVLTFMAVRFGVVNANSVQSASMTGGMVQNYEHTLLPSIPPAVTMLFTVLGMAPALYDLWLKGTTVAFLRTVILCAFTSFLFGWHVHEKAILMIIIPITLFIMYKKPYARIYLLLSTAGFYSLFPLLFTPFENALKVLLFLQTILFSFLSLHSVYSSEKSDTTLKSGTSQSILSILQLPLLDRIESLYIYGFIPLALFNSIGLWLLNIGDRLPFLPLMLTSVYCSFGVIYCWVKFYKLSFESEDVIASPQREVRDKKKK